MDCDFIKYIFEPPHRLKRYVYETFLRRLFWDTDWFKEIPVYTSIFFASEITVINLHFDYADYKLSSV